MSRIPSGRPIRNTGMKSVDSVIRRQSGLRNSNGDSSSVTQQKATNIENQFRYALLRKNLNFIEQASIGPWSIDFYLPEHDIIIEADGEFWHNTIKAKMKDRRKDAWLKSKGYKVFHFTGKEILENSNLCVEQILKSIAMGKMTQPHQEEIEENYEDGETLGQNDEYEQWVIGLSEFSSRSVS